MTDSNEKRGLLFVISGPSGVGKTVLCNKMVEIFSPSIVYSISATSRLPRGGEKDGQEYFFFTSDYFKAEIEKNSFAEWAIVHGNYYGTPKAFLDAQRSRGKHVILNIDVQGAMKIRSQYPESIMIFILPPTMEALEERIRKRNMDSEKTLRDRMANAKIEMGFQKEYSHVIVNDDLKISEKNLEDIFRNYIHARS